MNSICVRLVKMKSLVRHLDRLQSHENKVFALEPPPPHRQISLGTLTVDTAEGLQVRECCVVGGSLWDMTTPKKLCDLYWKVLVCFVEEKSSGLTTGFQLTGHDCNITFYTETAFNLRECRLTLSQFCILQDVEEDYELIEAIYHNDISTIFKARQITGDSIVAIKTIDSRCISANLANIQCFYDALTAIRRLNHDNVLKLHRVYEGQEHMHLISDYVASGDLMTLIEKRVQFSESKVKRFCRKLMKVLEYIHSQGVVHRDLKPENILLMSQDICDFKVSDFGLAGIANGMLLTLKCGSPGYIAPEILRGEPYGYKVDCFSAGVIVYMLYFSRRLSGQAPFYGRTAVESLQRNAEALVIFKGKVWSEVSSLAQNFIRHLLESAPSSRFDAATALKHPWLAEEEHYSYDVNDRIDRVNDSLPSSLDCFTSITGVSICIETFATKYDGNMPRPTI